MYKKHKIKLHANCTRRDVSVFPGVSSPVSYVCRVLDTWSGAEWRLRPAALDPPELDPGWSWRCGWMEFSAWSVGSPRPPPARKWSLLWLKPSVRSLNCFFNIVVFQEEDSNHYLCSLFTKLFISKQLYSYKPENNNGSIVSLHENVHNSLALFVVPNLYDFTNQTITKLEHLKWHETDLS